MRMENKEIEKTILEVFGLEKLGEDGVGFCSINVSSLILLNKIIEIEDKLGIEYTDINFKTFKSVKELIDYTCQMINP